jgi:hypothetical protein
MGLFGFGKKAAPSPQDEDMKLISAQIFPGGMEEEIFRSAKVVDLSNRKLTATEALNVFTKTKLRYKIACWRFDGEEHLGRTADDMIQRTIEDSEKKLSFLEAVGVVSYVIFDKIGPQLNTYESVKGSLQATFGADDQGYDCDEIPFAVGEFGRDVTNAIPSRGIGGVRVYLGRLRTASGEKVVAKRIRALAVESQPGKTDEYDVFTEGGEFLTKLYLCGYHQRVSRKAPRGFKLVSLGRPLLPGDTTGR